MIIDTVSRTISTRGLIRKGDTVVIGVSGGPDSLALMHILASLRKELHLSLHVAHLDHRLRKSSGKDLEFVAKEAESLGIPFTGGAAKIATPSEESCRKARHDFLFKTAKKTGADRIALGHTLDDQAETVLMRLVRGAGLLGLAGIAPSRAFGRFIVVRPLIDVTRAEIELYLKRKKLKPRRDETNEQDIYLRNRFRAELLPLLEKKYNPNIRRILSNTAENAGYDYDFLVKAAEKAAGGISSRIDLRRFNRLHPALKRIVLRLSAGKVQGDTRRLTFIHMKEIEDLILNRPVGSVVDLPRNISAAKRKNTLIFYRT
ncbi:MAG: tRNA lysidine(34) synthetase TilS [Deltaproteobacteria bacterium]